MANYISSLKEDLAGRKEELKLIVIALKKGETVDGRPIAKSTISTQLTIRRKEQRICTLLEEILSCVKAEQIKLSDEAYKGFTQLTDPETAGVKVTVNEGDEILATLEKYREVKDVASKLAKACTEKGLKLDYASNTIIKA